MATGEPFSRQCMIELLEHPQTGGQRYINELLRQTGPAAISVESDNSLPFMTRVHFEGFHPQTGERIGGGAELGGYHLMQPGQSPTSVLERSIIRVIRMAIAAGDDAEVGWGGVISAPAGITASTAAVERRRFILNSSHVYSNTWQAVREREFAPIHYERYAFDAPYPAPDARGMRPSMFGWGEVISTPAYERAEELLHAHLSPSQRRDWDERGYFDVDAPGRTYRITQKLTYNVLRPLDGARFCLSVPGVPQHDVYLAQKMLLECDEAAFLEIANRASAPWDL